MVNLELYKIFYEVANTKNITKASEKLNISQPAITKHIKNLENELNTPLFIRTKKGVILNEAGEKIYINIKNALTLIDEAEKTVNEYTNLNKGTIKIGISTTLAKKYLINHIKTFNKLYPNITIDIYTDPTKILAEKLKNGSIDLIIGKFNETKDLELNYKKIGTTNYIFAANNDYKNLKNKKINLKELTKYPLLLQKEPSNSKESIKKYFKRNNIETTPKMNISSSNLLIDFIKIGYGIGYVTKLYVEKELKTKELFEINIEEKPDQIIYGIITLKNNIMTLPCKKFIEHLTL